MKNCRIYLFIGLISTILHTPQLSAESISDWIRGTKSSTFKKEVTITPQTHVLIAQENIGNVTIRPSDKKNTIIIEEEQHGKAEKIKKAHITTQNRNNTLLITAPEEETSISMSIALPPHTPLSVSSASGNILIEDIHAPLVLETKYGSIYVNNATKSINATANRGIIEIDYQNVEPESTIALAATSHITLALPQSSSGNISASTQGKIISEHYITLDPITTKITPRTWKELLHNVSGKLGATKSKSNTTKQQAMPNNIILESTQKGKIAIREK